jgi:O-antigen/teichoic acid export membrane protein
MSIGKKTVLTFISIAATSIARLVVNKIFAVYLGTTGIALLAHFQNLIGILTQLPNDGVNRGLSRLLQNKKNIIEVRKLTGAALTYNIILFLLMAIIILIFNDYFFRFFFHTIDEGFFYLIFFLSVLIFIINLFLQAFILSLKNAAIYTISNILGIGLLLIVVYFGARTINVEYALLAFSTGQAISILITLVIILRYRSAEGLGLYFSSRNFKKLSEFLLIVFSVLVFSKLVDFGVRHYAISEYGFKLAGLWQAVVKISDSYMSLFIATVGVVFYPQVSALVFDTDQLRKYLKDVLYIVVPVTLVGLILIYIFRMPILNILFTADFVPAHYLMKFHLIGDFFGIISYLLIYIVSAQARTTTFISLQFGSAVLYIALIAFFTSFYGIEALPLAHAGRFVIFFMVLTIINRRILF